ncbi:MAG: asparagine synthase C-terminal domain-containing protein [Acidobacteria bacterium]|nr:asparagine synthase C-terminal domain-containing protein [Acidobacteriota bacterium]
MTIFAEIASLEPGATLVWNGRDIKVEQRLDLLDDSSKVRLTASAPTSLNELRRAGEASAFALWASADKTAVKKADSTKVSTPRYEEAVERVRLALEDAVRSHLVSDVPLGAFLSGGLDSSIVVALMRKATSGPIRTCSLVFEERDYSEGAYAREVADAVGSEHYERVITADEAASRLDEVFRAMDQPTSDGVNTYFVSETARQAGLTVALSGLGGDELFGGYPCTFRDAPALARTLEFTSKVPGAAALARATVDAMTNPRRWGNISAALDRPASLASAYVARRSVFSPAEVQTLLSDEVLEAAGGFDPVAHVVARTGSGGDQFSWLSRAELRSYTHHQLLRDTDVMSMAHSLEVRVPLLDDRLVRLVLGLPESVKREGSGPKPLLIAGAGDLLPARVRSRRDKHGFTLPFDRWLKTTLRSHFEDLFRSEASAGGSMCRPAGVRSLWDDYLAGGVHWSRPWAVAAFLRWCQEHQPPTS